MDLLDLYSLLFSRSASGKRLNECLRAGREWRHICPGSDLSLVVSLVLLLVAVVLNIIGLNIGKWLQNAGGVGTYLPLIDAGGDRINRLFQAWFR